MLVNKSLQLRNAILQLLENGSLPAGAKLPGARNIAEANGVALPVAQAAIENLAQFGVLRTVPRSGTYVQEEWFRQILPYSFRTTSHPFWHDVINPLVAGALPELHLTSQFDRAAMEVRVTHQLLSMHTEFLDMTPLLESCYPDCSIFMDGILEPFRINGKLCGVPLIFSSRLLLCDLELFEQAGCTLPPGGWSYQTLLETVGKLKQTLPPQQCFALQNSLHFYSSFVFRAGGAFVDATAAADPIRLDAPATVNGICRFAELLRLAGYSADTPPTGDMDPCAIRIATRQLYTQMRMLQPGRRFAALPLPFFDGGRDVNAMAAELLCVRRSCPHLELAKELVRFMLSETVQDRFAEWGYAIPVRKSSARKSIHFDSPIELLFLTEAAKCTAGYDMLTPELYQAISAGVTSIISLEPEKIPGALHDLADALRVMLRYCDWRPE